MANHKSALKRVRSDKKKYMRNRYYHKSARTAIRTLRTMSDHSEAAAFLPKVIAMVDRLAKRNIIHKNKAGNLKSGLTKHVNRLAA